MSARTWAWESMEPDGAAAARLEHFVRDLTRARRLQILVELGGGGLFFGLLAACAPVLAVRLGGLPWPEWPGAAAALGLCLGSAAFLAWRRRPDDLQVSILADLELRLEQRLSTAWELARREPDTPIATRLAALALARRLPMTHTVFPLRINTWGRLVPLAALVLALVGLLDIGARAPDLPVAVDSLVAEEGMRLREHGRRMEDRARRESLPESRKAAGALQRLGARMESGASSRRQALSRLRALDADLEHERRALLAEGLPAGAADLAADLAAGTPAASHLFSDGRLGALLSSVQQGALTPGDLRMLGTETTWISALGIAPAELEEALARYASGEYEALRQLLEELSGMDLAIRDAAMLWDAERAVELARENLGEHGVLLGFRGDRDGAPGEEGGALALLAARAPVKPDEDGGPFTALRGPGRGEGVEPESLPSLSPRSTRTPGEVALKLEGRPGEGEVFRTEARVLPRPGAVSTPAAALAPVFRGDVEAVLARQSYPLHHKALVRRYFLRLSEGGSGDGRTEHAP